MSQPRRPDQLPNWFPDWLVTLAPNPDQSGEQAAPAADFPPPDGIFLAPLSSARTAADDASGVISSSQATTGQTSPGQASSSHGPQDDNVFTYQHKVVTVRPSQDRRVNRNLGGLQISSITINCTLGVGLYWRGGQILELGGPLAVILAYLIPGFLAWSVMQCITELMCIWPIPGALSVYVGEFVDPELGIATGIAYWFTYAAAYASLVATMAAEIHYWKVPVDGFDAGILYFLVPIGIIFVNTVRVKIYGWIEVLTGSLKLLFLLTIICILIALNLGVGQNNDYKSLGLEYWDKMMEYDTEVAPNWITSLFMCFSIASFAYVGVEVVAASALETRWPMKNQRVKTDSSQRSNEAFLVERTAKYSAIYLPVFFTIIYVISGFLGTINIRSTDESLPRLGFKKQKSQTDSQLQGETTSFFVTIAKESKINGLDHVFNAFQVFTALTCASTNLYVASRSLFGLTSRLDGGSGQPRLLRILAWFGKTSRHKVPVRAMVFSAVVFAWVPFMQLKDSNFQIGVFIDIFNQMSTGTVIIVWAVNCWAFIRFYHCIYKHRKVLEREEIPLVRRWDRDNYRDYPYRSHGQPALAYLALAGCIFMLVVSEGSMLWKEFDAPPFLSAYLQLFIFGGLWVGLKVFRRAKWSLVDLSNSTKVVRKIRELHDARLGAG